MKLQYLLIIILFVAAIGSAMYYYPQMPDQMASHWNTKGEVDGYMSKFWGLFLLPIVMAAILVLFTVIPLIDPLKKNIEQFRGHFDWFIVMITAYMAYIYLLCLIWNMGVTYDMNKFIVPAMGVLFIYIAVLLKHAKRNWFIGIRTPWTLSSDEVWKKTHDLGAKLFFATGIIALFGFVFPDYTIWLILVPILVTVLVTVVYSYLEYQKVSK
ncbi:SdpI family protein [Nanoarchaeota archaeon]